jgi:hypothetical protein
MPIFVYSQEAYNNLTTELKVTLLLRAIQNAQVAEDGQIMATVLLRRVFSSDFQDFYPKVCQSKLTWLHHCNIVPSNSYLLKLKPN